jgi:hypothetical protein
MNHGSRLVFRPIAGLMLGVLGLAGCDAGDSAGPATGGAGIPNVRGPVSSKMPKPITAKTKAAAPDAAKTP